MNDFLVILALAALGAVAAGLPAAAAVRVLRRRSVALSLFAAGALAVVTMAAGTVAVAQAMFLSAHDLGVVMAVVAVSGLVSLAAALLFGRRIAAGSRQLAEAARTVGSEGGFAAPAEPPTAELATLAEALEETSARLARARERERALDAARRDLIAGISHDLRTPLAGLRAMAEALEDGVVRGADAARYHARIRVEVDRLAGMVDDLFELSRIQAGALTLTPSRVSVFDLVDDALAGARPLAAAGGVRLVDGGVAAVPVRVDAQQITRVLGNLLVNAIRATPDGGTVAVEAQRADGRVVLAVEDGCGGIPEADLPRVFDTGWRGAPARTPRADGGSGAGLGLAIVRGIVEAHAGRASVRNTERGCRFEVELPGG
ncbi:MULTISPECIES: sensor histidine kinase [Streptomyces]|uniref:histidine kinase n=2 Tax=Streptomyces rimosus subsp. rimosus TaxID=132474 RepID=L8ERB4_STRR1|nr:MULTISPECIES: HAMP domain-containing sensor histidine kinase [Streptomyces]KOG68646.1 histidine kinase [Kitasatospora aureofaciens]MYT42942.1 two-component sensor histidine kinase [Streptomyces sp. SID5471]KEF04984.1 histidine kinase [Streptomyces rimosus]KEF21927.1 histidine kinase [Streptomyces rimosus]KOT35572.1 histidine kinase [Streptomyces rimosus subsp. rimosus]